MIALQVADHTLAFGFPEDLDGQLVQPLEVGDVLPALGQVLFEPAGQLHGPLRSDPRADERASHQALRVRLLVASERQRIAVAALRHQATASAAGVIAASASPRMSTSRSG